MSTFVPRTSLTREDLDANPVAQFQLWFQEAEAKSGLEYPNAMTLATVDPEGWPQARIVLLKGVEDGAFVFYTNRESAKGVALAATPRAALVFYWESLARQVRVQGVVSTVTDPVSDGYFSSRPVGSRIGAWASAQSRPLESRAVLESRFRELEARYPDGQIPRPPHWGGYRLEPRMVEFWQEGASRLHDRFQYRARADGQWDVVRLNP
ncbi:MAG: pyridoxamine 5'-phosphate oxidase [Gemmatimonadota bacterium]